MVLDAYGETEDQYDCANQFVGGRQETVTMSGKVNSVDKVLAWASAGSNTIGTKYDQSTLYQQYLTAALDLRRPVIAGIILSNNAAHMVVITGYSGTGGSNAGDVIFKDPSNAYYPTGRRTLSYSKFEGTVGSSWCWNETLRLTTAPRNPIPTGMYDWCRIYDGGIINITPSATSLSYTAGFGSFDTPPAHPVSWTWNLVFVHSYGDCIARTWTSTSTANTSTWNITGFSLPTGYDWYFNYDGNICGRVELDVLDSDGYHHLDNVGVFYLPSNQYSGYIIYEDNTVSSSQPEVKAHQMITTQNDQFNSIGTITFRAGEKIDIKDGITINNGSTTNFIVDPSIR